MNRLFQSEKTFPGGTLLLKACEGELSEFVEVLLEQGRVDPNYTPPGFRLSPILMAAKKGKEIYKNMIR